MSDNMCDTSPTSPTPLRKVYMDGKPVLGVEEAVVKVGRWNETVQVSFNPRQVTVTPNSIHITLHEDNNRYTKEQLRELIIKNLDNHEAIQWINNLKLNQGEENESL